MWRSYASKRAVAGNVRRKYANHSSKSKCTTTYGVVKTTCSVPPGIGGGSKRTYQFSFFLPLWAARNDCPVNGSGDQVLKNALVAFSAVADVEAHSRILHLAGSNATARDACRRLQRLPKWWCRWSRLPVPHKHRKSPAGELRCGQRARRRCTRHVEVLGPGDDVRERRHLL
jgi:hypothetical protein